MFEKADFDEKVGLKFFWFLWVLAFKRTSTDVVYKNCAVQGTTETRKIWDQLFRQNLLFRTSTVSKLAMSEGLPSGVLNLCQKMLKISPKSVIFRLNAANQMNFGFKTVKMWYIGLLKEFLGNLSKNCPKKWIIGSKKCGNFVKNCQFFKIGVWKLLKNRQNF